MTEHVIRTDPADGVAVLMFTRPEVRNALNRQSWNELTQLATEVAHDRRVRAVVLTGGDSFFSAGGDISGMGKPEGGALAVSERLSHAHAAWRALHEIPQPLIGAVEGYAIGAGWSLALACDIVTAGRSAYFQVSFLNRGFVPDGGFVGLMTHAFGRMATMDLLLSGRRVTAEKAASLGMITRVVEPGQAVAAVIEQAREIAAMPSDAVRLTKQMMRKAGPSITDVLEAEVTPWTLGWHSPDAIEGRQAFLEKRPPKYNAYLEVEEVEV